MIPKISVSEWRIMKLIWTKSPRSANDIIAELKDVVDWQPKTIKTLLNRLVTKGALSFEKEGRSYLYYPKFGEDECQREERKFFLNRVYNDSLKPMLAAFINDENMTKDDIEELKKILEQKEDKQ
jgi:BlaI family transcriptional regulator, penicillinase repressor